MFFRDQIMESTRNSLLDDRQRRLRHGYLAQDTWIDKKSRLKVPHKTESRLRRVAA